jgi:hypothetical protein
MLIVYSDPGRGWEPVTYMVKLAAELLEADLLLYDSSATPGLWDRLEQVVLRRQRDKGHESCLLVCANPINFRNLSVIEGWRKRFKFLAAWVIDSFWLEWIPTPTKLSRPFDHIFVTTEEEIPEWLRVMKTPTSCLPWGTDALRLGGNSVERIWDLTRVGRQPPEWEEDAITEQLCLERNLRFHGRPKFFGDASKNQQNLMNFYQQTKFQLAFSNLVNPAEHTHPSREYLTARWVDALACGAILAGVSPKSPSVSRLLWDGATLELGSIKVKDGLQVIAEAVRDWRPEQAQTNYQKALERLDWRLRFAVLADIFQESPKRLNDELHCLKQKIELCESQKLGQSSPVDHQP